MTHLARVSLALCGLAVSADALACGGFFCNRDPIDQSGEKIVFAIDEAEGKVEVHVRVAYEGPSEDFAWIVPVSGIPELFLSTEALFDALEVRTRPSFRYTTEQRGSCTWGHDTAYWPESGVLFDTSSADSGDATDSDSDGGTPDVQLLDSRDVGPYATQTLSATNADALYTWLTNAGYVLPPDLAPRLAPYIAEGSNFVALRMQKDATSGELAPLGMRYDGTRPVIPIQLTAVAATPDMRLVPYVLGSARAVPVNYLHVVINEAAVDWFRFGANYDDVVTDAADEAGGQAFATDFAGPTTGMSTSLWAPGAFDTTRLAGMTDLYTFMDELLFGQSFSSSQTLLSLLRTHVPMPQVLRDRGVPETAFYNCVRCYPEASSIPFDAPAFAADLEAQIVEPRRHAAGLLSQHPWITRLTSSMSPAEMTADPQFDLNPALPAVSREHHAVLYLECPQGERFDEALRTLTLSDGREILLPPSGWMRDQGTSESEFLGELGEPAALRIEQMFPDEETEPMVDNTPDALDQLDSFNQHVRELLGLVDTSEDTPADVSTPASSCGCATGRAPGAGGLLLLGLVGLRRRR